MRRAPPLRARLKEGLAAGLLTNKRNAAGASAGKNEHVSIVESPRNKQWLRSRKIAECLAKNQPRVAQEDEVIRKGKD